MMMRTVQMKMRMMIIQQYFTRVNARMDNTTFTTHSLMQINANDADTIDKPMEYTIVNNTHHVA